jgi:hypothetical protein
MTARGRQDEAEAFAQAATRDFDAFGIHPIDADVFDETIETPIRTLRRARRHRGEGERVGYMSLVETDGILRWQLGAGPAPSRRGPRRRARIGLPRPAADRVIRQFKFADLPPNEIGDKLRQLDTRLTPRQGLRDVTRTLTVGRESTPATKGRILLIVHGTFSSGDHVVEEMTSTADGRRLLERALTGGRYTQVLAFNHPTLSVSPILNAAALAHHFRTSDADVDVICHSRGGLVVRWWLEVLDHRSQPRGRVIFAGPPLAGTGLAAPARLRGALNLLTNLSHALGTLARTTGRVFPAAAPIGEAAGVLFGMFGKLTALAARTPIIDAGIAMIPGLAGQSREGANGELLRLRDSFSQLEGTLRTERYLVNYYFLKSNFEPADPAWRFWQYFRRDRLLDAAADLVFDGPNDLVVDTDSMASLADGIADEEIDVGRIETFGGTSVDVHHLNYFQQPETLSLIRNALQLA